MKKKKTIIILIVSFIVLLFLDVLLPDPTEEIWRNSELIGSWLYSSNVVKICTSRYHLFYLVYDNRELISCVFAIICIIFIIIKILLDKKNNKKEYFIIGLLVTLCIIYLIKIVGLFSYAIYNYEVGKCEDVMIEKG